MNNMELWIRTQNRMRIFKIVLDVSINAVCNEDHELDHYMIGCNDYEMEYELGFYKTKERALEILDEIFDLLYDYSDLKTIKYQMPLE